MSAHVITRQIGIDAGHRVPHHGSKCRNLHGHRYTIEVTCVGPLFEAGEQQGMVLDFGFLKEEMMAEIDAPCDHGMIIWSDDPLLRIFAPEDLTGCDDVNDWVEEQRLRAKIVGGISTTGAAGKIYVVPFVPTAENLARHWFERLEPRVQARTNGQATLLKVVVWETPNCSASYPARALLGRSLDRRELLEAEPQRGLESLLPP